MEKFYEWFFLEKGRTGDPLFSWQHLLSVTVTLGIFMFLAIWLGKKFKGNDKNQRIALGIAGILIVLIQILKMIWVCQGSTDIWKTLVGNAPLYLCDMAIFILPLTAITFGRFRDWCLDFISIWGILMGFFGTYFAGNIYPAHAAISFGALNSLLNHALSLFGGVFIFVSGLNKMEKRNIPFTVGILLIFMTTALVIDYVDTHNFMFFFHGDGTPFTFFQEYLSFGLTPVYQAWIYLLQCGYMVGFYFAYYGVKKAIAKHQEKKSTKLATATESK